MKLQIQPNNWSCLLTSFAMAMDVDQNELIAEIGHDGSQIIWPELEEPYNRRTFHPQELFVCCYRRRLIVMELCRRTITTPYTDLDEGKLFIQEWDWIFDNWLMGNCGVLLGIEFKGNPHAVAWDGERIYDPRGIVRSIESFHCNTFFMMKQL